MIYLHVSKARSRHIADRLNARLREACPQVDGDSVRHVEGSLIEAKGQEGRRTPSRCASRVAPAANDEGGRESRSDLRKRGGGDEGT
jgi:hypothetical protein